MNPQPKGPPKGSRNAAKGEEDMTSKLILRCTPREKAGWVKQAQAKNMKLAEWVRENLNTLQTSNEMNTHIFLNIPPQVSLAVSIYDLALTNKISEDEVAEKAKPLGKVWGEAMISLYRYLSGETDNLNETKADMITASSKVISQTGMGRNGRGYTGYSDMNLHQRARRVAEALFSI